MEIAAFLAVTIGFIVFFLGAFLTRKVAILRDYNLPEPVVGGIVVACFIWGWYALTGTQITFDLQVRDYLLVAFFATIGLNARLADILRGGRMLLLLLMMTLCFIILQNLIGLIGALFFDLPAPVGVLMGSAALIGGHGTAIAWGPTIEAQTGFAAASEIGIASATLGLIVAALMGGPIAKYLITKHNLKSDSHDDHIVGLEMADDGQQSGMVNHVSLMRSMLAVHIAIFLGWFLHAAITETGLKLPLFVPCLLMGIFLSNTVPYVLPRLSWPARTNAMAVISDYCLSVFLAMSLMAMQLWTLAEMGGTLLFVLMLQIILAATVITFILFRILGSDYTSAVLCAGFAGFTLGATPTAIANMSSVTKRYGPSPLAFIILPLVSAFFVDLANAVVIQIFTSF